MAGGRGTRLRRSGIHVEKPLLRLCGKPMVDHVVEALEGASLDTVYVAVSPHTPETQSYLESDDQVSLIQTSGDGYVEDIGYCIEEIGAPVLTATSDIPLIQPDLVDAVLDEYDGRSLTVATSLRLRESVGVDVDDSKVYDGTVPTGLNVVGEDGGEKRIIVDDEDLAVNVNTANDAEIARQILERKSESKTD